MMTAGVRVHWAKTDRGSLLDLNHERVQTTFINVIFAVQIHHPPYDCFPFFATTATAGSEC